MVTDAAAMAVVRAARPALRGAHDGVAFAVHATFLAAGYSLCAVGPAALADLSPSGDEEAGIDGWNSMENCYAFLYSKEEKGKKKRVLLKCLVIGEVLAIDVLDLEAQDKGLHINVKDFFVEEQPKNYGEMYKNFASLIETMNSNVLCKFDGNVASAEAAKNAAAAAAAKNSDAERSSSIQSSEDPGPRTADPSGSYHLHSPRIGTAGARGGGKGRSRSIQGGGEKMAKLSEKTSLLGEAEKRIELTSKVEEQQKLKGYSSPDREGGGRGQQSVRQSTRCRQVNWSPLPPLSSPVSTIRVSWSEAHTLLLYGYCVEEIESSSLEELSENSYEIITQKLCDKGANHNIKSVKEKVRGTKKLYTFWKDKVMNPCVVKDEKWWAKQGRQYQKLRDGPPKHLNLIKRIFEPCEKSSGRGLHESAQSQLFELRTQSDENQAAEAEICLLMNEVKMVCHLMDEFERARAQSVSVQREKEEVDDIDIERVEQLTSAYNLALAAAKENPTDDKFTRAAVKARLALTAAVLRPD